MSQCDNYFGNFAVKLLETPSLIKNKDVLYDFICFYLKIINVTIKKVICKKERLNNDDKTVDLLKNVY